MFGIILCAGCRRPRIADLSDKTSVCPYCGDAAEHRACVIHYESEDQTECRNALAQFTGFVPDHKKKEETRKNIAEKDPFSTLIYRYEHGSSVQDKMEILAKGLTAIFGTFTLSDVEKVDPKNGEDAQSHARRVPHR